MVAEPHELFTAEQIEMFGKTKSKLVKKAKIAVEVSDDESENAEDVKSCYLLAENHFSSTRNFIKETIGDPFDLVDRLFHRLRRAMYNNSGVILYRIDTNKAELVVYISYVRHQVMDETGKSGEEFSDISKFATSLGLNMEIIFLSTIFDRIKAKERISLYVLGKEIFYAPSSTVANEPTGQPFDFGELLRQVQGNSTIPLSSKYRRQSIAVFSANLEQESTVVLNLNDHLKYLASVYSFQLPDEGEKISEYEKKLLRLSATKRFLLAPDGHIPNSVIRLGLNEKYDAFKSKLNGTDSDLWSLNGDKKNGQMGKRIKFRKKNLVWQNQNSVQNLWDESDGFIMSSDSNDSDDQSRKVDDKPIAKQSTLANEEPKKSAQIEWSKLRVSTNISAGLTKKLSTNDSTNATEKSSTVVVTSRQLVKEPIKEIPKEPQVSLAKEEPHPSIEKSALTKQLSHPARLQSSTPKLASLVYDMKCCSATEACKTPKQTGSGDANGKVEKKSNSDEKLEGAHIVNGQQEMKPIQEGVGKSAIKENKTANSRPLESSGISEKSLEKSSANFNKKTTTKSAVKRNPSSKGNRLSPENPVLYQYYDRLENERKVKSSLTRWHKQEFNVPEPSVDQSVDCLQSKTNETTKKPTRKINVQFLLEDSNSNSISGKSSITVFSLKMSLQCIF